MQLDELQTLVASEDAVLGYFSTPDCNVCKVLRPKIEALLADRFEKMRFVYVDCAAAPDTAAQLGVLTVPSVVAWFDGREFTRKVRTFGIDELSDALARPYGLLFD